MRLPWIAVLALTACCPGRPSYPRPATTPTVEGLLLQLANDRAGRTSFQAEAVMDYWLGNDRVKGTVLVMGKAGSYVRMNALSPAGGDVIADLACDGTNFVFIDKQNNCVLTGPCNADSIGHFLRVPLSPDQLLNLATGTTPVLDGASGTVEWDAEAGRWILDLTAPAGRQTVAIADQQRIAISKVVDNAGKPVWQIENRGSVEVADGGSPGVVHHVAERTRFTSPQGKSDLLVDWKKRKFNLPLDDAKFLPEVPVGLPRCGNQP